MFLTSLANNEWQEIGEFMVKKAIERYKVRPN